MQFALRNALRGGFAIALAAALAPASIAQNISRVDGSTHPGTGVTTPTQPTTTSVGGAITITQSTSQAITTGNSVSCNSGGLHTDNSYFRVFDLASHGITSDFEITSVETGVEQSVGGSGPQPVEWKFYRLTDPAGPVARANFTSLGTVPTTVPDLTAALHSTAITGVTAPAGSRLVVELFTPNGQTSMNSFFLGSNPDGQSGPTYLEAAPCGVTTPTPTGAIGFPNMHWVLNVTGNVSSGPVVNTYPSTDTPLPIADGTGDNTPGAPTVSTIVVPPSPNEVVDVDVQLTLTHTWAGDLAATLVHLGPSSAVYDRPGRTTTGFGCSGDNPTLTIDDEGTGGTVEGSCTNTTTAYPAGVNYTPNTPLSVFDGLPADGNWVLTVNDFAGGDTGSLTSWAIIVTEDNTVNAPGSPTAGEASLRALPNPISASGTVELTVPVAQQVRVAVYDMLGREVMVLLDRTVAESQRAYMSVEAGRLEPGAYIIRAVGETFQMSQRVSITR